MYFFLVKKGGGELRHVIVYVREHIVSLYYAGLSHPFLGLGPGALGIGENSGVFLKIGK